MHFITLIKVNRLIAIVELCALMLFIVCVVPLIFSLIRW